MSATVLAMPPALIGHFRVRSFAGVVAAHGIVAWLLLSLAVSTTSIQQAEPLQVFDVREAILPPPPQPEAPKPPPARAPVSPQPQGADARMPRPAAVAPPQSSEVTRQVSAPSATASAGSAPASDPTGGNASGAGIGSIGSGAGGGGGSPVQRPRLQGGRIMPRDYPRAAAGAQGIVTVQLTIATSGAVSGCAVARSSGNAVLDATTCRLIRERFRYAPARAADGRAVVDLVGWQQRWWRD